MSLLLTTNDLPYLIGLLPAFLLLARIAYGGCDYAAR